MRRWLGAGWGWPLSKFNPRTRDLGLDHNQVFDRIVEKINQHRGDIDHLASLIAASGQPLAFNNSGLAIVPGLIYGLASGLIVPAFSGLYPVEPAFQALSGAAPGASFRIQIVGPSRVTLEDPGAGVTAGGWGWLSPNVGGKVTLTIPAAGRRYRVCQFADGLVDLKGTVSAYLFIFPQGATSL